MTEVPAWVDQLALEIATEVCTSTSQGPQVLALCQIAATKALSHRTDAGGEPCGLCSGTGTVESSMGPNGLKACPHCNGQGKIASAPPPDRGAALREAAPDLLRVAELLVDWLNEEEGAHKLCDVAHAAIRKAKGE